MIEESTYYNLRVEFIDELTYQFDMRKRLDMMRRSSIVEPGKVSQTEKLIENSCKRCRCYDYIIQEAATKYYKK